MKIKIVHSKLEKHARPIQPKTAISRRVTAVGVSTSSNHLITAPTEWERYNSLRLCEHPCEAIVSIWRGRGRWMLRMVRPAVKRRLTRTKRRHLIVCNVPYYVTTVLLLHGKSANMNVTKLLKAARPETWPTESSSVICRSVREK